jgi:hypothetical protein
MVVISLWLLERVRKIRSLSCDVAFCLGSARIEVKVSTTLRK